MIQTHHDGSADRAKTFAAIIADYSDLSAIRNHPIPEYNVTTADGEVTDECYRRNASFRMGFHSLKDATDLTDYGWQEGSDKGSAVSLSLEGTIAAVEAIRQRPVWGDSGDSLCTDRALRGDWDIAFQSSGRVRTNGSKIVTLVGAFGGHCHRTTEELFWNGIQIVVTADILENAGYQCEIIGGNNNFQRPTSTIGFAGIIAKRAGDPLRIDQIASVFAHAGVFRTIGFEMIVRTPTEVGCGLGTPRMSVGEMTLSVRKLEAAGLLPSDSIIIGEAYDQKSAIKNIRATLHAVTGELPVAA